MDPYPWFMKRWYFWGRKFAFQLPGCQLWFKGPKLTPWDHNPKTGEIRFGLNYTLIKRLKESGVTPEKVKFVSWV